jgi:hypothetical protein
MISRRILVASRLLREKDDSALAPVAKEKKLEPLVQDQPKKESLLLTQTKSKTEPKPSSSTPALGDKEERRVIELSFSDC